MEHSETSEDIQKKKKPGQSYHTVYTNAKAGKQTRSNFLAICSFFFFNDFLEFNLQNQWKGLALTYASRMSFFFPLFLNEE